MSTRLVFLATFALATATLAGQTDWSQASPTMRPLPRSGQAMASVGVIGRVVLFGGEAPQGNLLNGTWTWDGNDWQLLAPAASPPGRADAALCYDNFRGRLVMFGGSVDPGGGNFVAVDETWEFDGGTWLQRTPAVRPPPRDGHAMAFDIARGRGVLFGGFDGNNPLGDTWEWDGAAWQQRAPAASPSPRLAFAMAYDFPRQRVVLFGGDDANGSQGDTWEWDGASWLVRSPSHSPSARAAHGMAYDALRQRVVLFGGEDAGGARSDTWEWDGTDWTRRATPSSPTAHGPALSFAYDASRRECVLFGGEDINGNPLVDTWRYGPTTPATWVRFGSGCAGSNGTPGLDGSLPWLGDNLTVRADNLPLAGGAAFVAFGFSNTSWGALSLPLGLGPLGMPGCTAHVAISVALPVPIQSGSALLTFPVPGRPVLLGGRFFNQAVVLDPGAGNALGATVSNAGEGVIGGR